MLQICLILTQLEHQRVIFGESISSITQGYLLLISYLYNKIEAEVQPSNINSKRIRCIFDIAKVSNEVQ